MYKILVTCVMVGAMSGHFAFAQTAPQSTSTTPPAVATGAANNTTAAPVPGANSFTESQVKKRLEEKGYMQVTGLKKDEKSIWRGHAMKDGKSVDVALDYQGNITAN